MGKKGYMILINFFFSNKCFVRSDQETISRRKGDKTETNTPLNSETNLILTFHDHGICLATLI